MESATTVTPVEPAYSSTGQTVIIIVLVIIGLILFFYFLIELILIPPPTIVPFTNGTKIKIRSLGNDMYLRALLCADVNTSIPCTSSGSSDVCGSQLMVIADANSSDATIWTLQQYTLKSNAADVSAIEAAYVLVANRNGGVMTINSQNPDEFLLFTDPNVSPGIIVGTEMTCGTTQYFFNFLLVEANSVNTNTVNQPGTYLIKSITPPDWIAGGPEAACAGISQIGNRAYFLKSDGSKPVDTCAVPIVQIIQEASATDRTSIQQSLNYSFEIEIQ